MGHGHHSEYDSDTELDKETLLKLKQAELEIREFEAPLREKMIRAGFILGILLFIVGAVALFAYLKS